MQIITLQIRLPLVLAFSMLLMGIFSTSPKSRAESVEGHADIVQLTGKGEKSLQPPQLTCDVAADKAAETQVDWRPAAVGDQVILGNCVRTLADSQMGLTIPRSDQIKLGPLTVAQLKGIIETREFKQARLKVDHGKVWGQSRPGLIAGNRHYCRNVLRIGWSMTTPFA